MRVNPERGKRGLPRGRVRSSRRARPLAISSSPAKKRQATTADMTEPLRTFIRAVGVELSDTDRTEIRRKLGMRLGKFTGSIERVSVRVRDVNGPRGGVDQACRVKVVLSGMPSVVVENKEASLSTAIDGALSGVEQAVKRSVRRRRMKPLKRAK